MEEKNKMPREYAGIVMISLLLALPGILEEGSLSVVAILIVLWGILLYVIRIYEMVKRYLDKD